MQACNIQKAVAIPITDELQELPTKELSSEFVTT